RQQSDHARGMVADSRTVKTVGFFARPERGTLGKDRIEVRADADDGCDALALQGAQDVTQFVDLNIFKAERGKSVAQPFTARGFAKRRRGNLSELALPAAEFQLLVVKVCESGVDTPHLCDAGNLALGGDPRGVRNRGAAGDL